MESERILLEGICSQVDDKLDNGELVDTTSLSDYVSGLELAYRDFAQDYITLANGYHGKLQDLKASGKKELIRGISDMSLGRVFWNTLFGGVAGGAVGQDPYNATAGAIVGASLTVADEVTRSGLNLTYAFWGVILGSLIGDAYLGAYVGAGIGGGLGLAKGVADVMKNKRKGNKMLAQSKITQLELDFKTRRNNLIEGTLPKLLGDGSD